MSNYEMVTKVCQHQDRKEGKIIFKGITTGGKIIKDFLTISQEVRGGEFLRLKYLIMITFTETRKLSDLFELKYLHSYRKNKFNKDLDFCLDKGYELVGNINFSIWTGYTVVLIK